MILSYGAAGLVAAGLILTTSVALAAPPAPAPGRSAPPGNAEQGPPPSSFAPSPPRSSPADVPHPAVPQVSQDAAARTRMRECGHQWSALKKAGNVGTLTWKEFSATCLVVSR